MNPVKLSDRWRDEAHILFKWYTSLLKRPEREAYNNLTLESKARAEKSSKTSTLLRAAKNKKDDTAKELEDGSEAFLKRTFLRVISEHGNDLTRCSRCHLICSPEAIVCPHCCLLLK